MATRGSFESDQAIWATTRLHEQYPVLDVPPGVTPLVEIVYRDNRIVVDYGTEDLILLGAIEIGTGADIPLWEIDWWEGPTAEQYVVESAHDGYCLATSDAFEDREGLVLAWHRPGRPSLRVKVKHPRYVDMHRIITGSTERDVWRAIVVEDWRERAPLFAIAKVLNVSAAAAVNLPLLGEAIAAVPVEFARALNTVVDRLRDAHAALVRRIDHAWADRPSGNRRVFAEWARTTGFATLLFSRLDDHPWELEAWALVRPEAVPVGFGVRDEEG